MAGAGYYENTRLATTSLVLSAISFISFAPVSIRFYSSPSLPNKQKNDDIAPAVTYLNAELQKDQILKENIDKSGVYR